MTQQHGQEDEGGLSESSRLAALRRVYITFVVLFLRSVLHQARIEQQYLTTSYEPDCEYDNGEIQERNVGERPHSILQTRFILHLGPLEQTAEIQLFVGQRIQIGPGKYRCAGHLRVQGTGATRPHLLDPALPRD